MYKKLFFTLMSLSVILSCVQEERVSLSEIFVEDDLDTGKVELNDTILNFKIVVPASWVVKEASEARYYVHEPHNSKLDVRTSVEIKRVPKDGLQFLSDSLKSVWLADSSHIDITIEEEREVVFKDKRSIEIIANSKVQSHKKEFELRWRTMVLETDLWVYILSITTSPEKFDQQKSLIQVIFDSFEPEIFKN